MSGGSVSSGSYFRAIFEPFITHKITNLVSFGYKEKITLSDVLFSIEAYGLYMKYLYLFS